MPWTRDVRVTGHERIPEVEVHVTVGVQEDDRGVEGRAVGDRHREVVVVRLEDGQAGVATVAERHGARAVVVVLEARRGALRRGATRSQVSSTVPVPTEPFHPPTRM